MKMGEIYLRYAQTTVGDLGLRLGRSALASAPDLLLRNGPSLNADPPDLAAKQLMIDLLEKQ